MTVDFQDGATVDHDFVDGDEDGGIRTPDESHVAKLQRWVSALNIADDLDDDTLASIGQKVVFEYEIDFSSLGDWREKIEKAEKIANQVTEMKQYPWPKASNVIYPLITTASIQFAARAYPAIVNGRSIVKGVVIGNDAGVPVVVNGQPQIDPMTGQPAWVLPPGAKQERADKIGEHMSYQLLDEQTEWEPETDKLLHVLPIMGTAFRKVYFDASKKRNASLYVSAADLVVNYRARSLERAPRITEEVSFYPVEVHEKALSGEWLDDDYGAVPGSENDVDAPIEFLEQHRWLDLDEDGYPEPYIVTVCKHTSKVARIVARYDLDGIHYNFSKGRIQKIDPIHYYEAYQFLPNFEFKGSIYGTGFGMLLLPLNESINTTLNMLIDAGHLANTQGGFVGKGLSMNAGSMRFQPGEYKVINAQGAAIRDNIVQLQFPGPSPVLFQLLGMLVEAGKEIASVKDVLTGETQSANTPATVVLAQIEQGLKVFTSIYKRIYRSLKGELGKLYRLNRIYLNDETSYKIGSDWKTITRADYEKGSGVEPVADPSMVSDMQKLGKAGFMMQFVADPSMNGKEIKLEMLKAAAIDNPERFFLPNPPPNPAVLAKAAELATKQAETQANVELRHAQALLAKAQAINFFAQADKAVGDQHLAWIQQQLEMLRLAMEGMGHEQAAGAGAENAPAGGPLAATAPMPPHIQLPQQPGMPAPMPTNPHSFLAAAHNTGDIPG